AKPRANPHRGTRTTRRPPGSGARNPKKSIADGSWSVQQKREVVMKLAGTYPMRLLCQLLAVPRSSVYYQAQPVPDADAMLKAVLLELAGEWPTYGYRRLTAMMRRLDRPVNTKRVRRWMDELGINGAPPSRGHRTTNSKHAFPRYPNLVQNLEITRPEQVWVADITYIRLRSEFVYLAVLMDVFTR